jgi:RNA recognition motif-containing protein
LPYPVQLYKSFCIRACEPATGANSKSTVTISGYPDTFTEKDLTELLGADKIKKVIFTSKRADVTFKSSKWAQKVLIIDGVPIGGSKLTVKSLTEAAEPVKSESAVGLTNLYVKDLAKEATSEQVRRAFARYGKISSFSLINKEQFTTNVAFVSYVGADKAKNAFENAVTDMEDFGKFEVFWHKPKAGLKQELIEDINSQV